MDNLRSVPFSLEAEQSVIGSILIDNKKYSDVASIITADDFYLPELRDMYLAIGRLMTGEGNGGVDAVTLIDETLKIADKRDAKGERADGYRRSRTRDSVTADVMRIAEVVPIAANARGYANIVRDKSMLRSLINVCSEIMTDAYSENAETEDIVNLASRRVMELSRSGTQRDFVQLFELLRGEQERMRILERQRSEGKVPETGIKTGYGDLDRTLVGMERGDLVIIGARPGMGKTSFVLNIAANAAKRSGKSVAVFSLEMSGDQLAQRMISSEAMVDSNELRTAIFANGRDAWRKINDAVNYLKTCDVLIDDTAGMSVSKMDAKLRRVDNLGLVIIDYLQLMQSEKRFENRVTEVADITRSLKLMAKRLGVPVICCAQLSRASETRTDKRPMLSDLRESGSIEQDADIVLFLHRDYLNAEPGAMSEAFVIVAKNRHGQTNMGGIPFTWDPRFTKFIATTSEYQQ